MSFLKKDQCEPFEHSNHFQLDDSILNFRGVGYFFFFLVYQMDDKKTSCLWGLSVYSGCAFSDYTCRNMYAFLHMRFCIVFKKK